MITSIRLVNFKNFADETLRVRSVHGHRRGERQRQEQYPRRLPLPARHWAGLYAGGDFRRQTRGRVATDPWRDE